MKSIKITESIVLIDDEDFDYINLYDLKIDSNGYVYCSLKNKYEKMGLYSGITLHKLLMNPDKKGRNVVVDHIDGNKLNNQKKNLRICTHRENMQNRKVQDVYAGQKKTSKYKGIHRNKDTGTWELVVGTNIWKGLYDDEIAAANAYNYYALEMFGEFAKLNDVPYMPKEEWERNRRGNDKTSKFRGVSIVNGKYLAQIWDSKHKKNIRIGNYDNEIEAAIAYNDKAIELNGSKAKLNKI